MAIRSQLRSLLLSALCILSGCSTIYSEQQLNEMYGQPQVQNRLRTADASTPEYHRDIKPIFDRRCVVCHACYDAPCQLKLDSSAGIDRGAHSEKVYDGTRLLAARMTRMFIDEKETAGWRQRGFYPVLNERAQVSEANRDGSVLMRMLELKQQHPLPEQAILPSSFDFGLDRDQQCSRIEDFNEFANNYPLWGMPYGLPELSDEEFSTIERWVEAGAPVEPTPGLPAHLQVQVADWEKFLNGSSGKEQLMSRYIYEHLFVGHLYFPRRADRGDERQYFQLVRSRTAPGQPIDVIATRRPYDNPGVKTFYYRLLPVSETIVAKTHMPYVLDQARLQRWREWFLDADYEVKSLPGYGDAVGANPFVSFQALPVRSRYRFLLDEAQFTIMGFIKGPVCRGQVALNVIDDHFWVMFVDPEAPGMEASAEFLARASSDLRLPTEKASNAVPLTSWLAYSAMNERLQLAREKHLEALFPEPGALTLDLLWDGDGHNANAALTVFRQFDSATVVKGLQGGDPKTAWVFSYSLLERVHYLLVAGFDVYGNVGHQLLSRLYMDFLRIEGEINFLEFMPDAFALQQARFWNRGHEDEVADYIDRMWDGQRKRSRSGIVFQSDNPQRELFALYRQKVGATVVAPDLHQAKAADPVQAALQELTKVKGRALSWLPEHAILRSGDQVYSLLLNRGHSNVSSLFGEADRLLPDENTLSVLAGAASAYPNVFFEVEPAQLPAFGEAVAALRSEDDYRALLDRFAIRRSDPRFWAFSDGLHAHYQHTEPEAAGVLDYNRLENR